MKTTFNTLEKYGVKYTYQEFLEIIDAMKHNLKVISKIEHNEYDEFHLNLRDYIQFARIDTSEFNIFFVLSISIRCNTYNKSSFFIYTINTVKPLI